MNRAILVLGLLTSCCFNANPSFAILPPYVGPRDKAAIVRILERRHGWSTLAATGVGTLKSGEETRVFNFELLVDRKRGRVVFTGDKALTGTLFTLTLVPQKAVLEDFTGKEPVISELDPSRPLDMLGGGTVTDIRRGLLQWPPQAELKDNGSEIQWDVFRIDAVTLSIRKAIMKGMTGDFLGENELPSGRVRHDVWDFGRGDSSLRLVFDADMEFDVPLDENS